MHFVFGGAFNGKRKWVKKHYENQIDQWHSAYDHPISFTSITPFKKCTVIEGIELYVKELLSRGMTVSDVCNTFETTLNQWKDANGLDNMILIGTEIGKGIVPMGEEDRNWRDACGYVYQMLVQEARIVDYIWYGIVNRLKEEV
ncbi:hypothetical protein FZC66_11045 [Priestia megaterium]|nr:hypothetical protein FZC66_11045 [Priestia megaterium]